MFKKVILFISFISITAMADSAIVPKTTLCDCEVTCANGDFYEARWTCEIRGAELVPSGACSEQGGVVGEPSCEEDEVSAYSRELESAVANVPSVDIDRLSMQLEEVERRARDNRESEEMLRTQRSPLLPFPPRIRELSEETMEERYKRILEEQLRMIEEIEEEARRSNRAILGIPSSHF